MKKLFAGIFATVLGVSTLTACLDSKNVTYNVQGAADFLDAVYIDQIVDGRVDYEVLNTVSYQGATYDVEWSIDVTEGVTLVKGETSTKVDVDEASPADVEYVLTATVSDPNGNTATVSFYATLLQAKALIPVEITEKPVEGTAYKLYVYNNDAKKDCYFNGNYQATFYLGSVEDYEESVDVYVEYVEGSDTLFNLYYEHTLDGKQYVGLRENWNNTKGYWSYNPVIANEPVSSFEYSTEYKTIISVVPACSEDKQDAVQDTTKTLYWGNSGGTYTSIGGVEIEEFGKDGYVANLVTLQSAAGVSAADKVAFEKDALQLEESYVGDNTVTVSTYGKRYPDVKIEWAVSGDNLAYEDGTITITAPTAETTATVTATFTLGETTDTKEFTITLKPAIVVPDAGSTLTIPEAVALGNQFEKDSYTEGKYYVTGKVKSVANTTYGNLYIEDESGNELYVYGLYDEEGTNRYDAMETKPVVGDTITVYGVIGKYSSAQMKNGWMTAYTAGEGGEEAPVVLPEQTDANTLTIDEILAMSITSDTTEKYYVTATLSEVYNTQYGNMYVTDEDGTELTVYGTYSADGKVRYDAMETKPAVGDTITFYSVISQYNGTPQLKNAWIVKVVAGEGGEESSEITASKTIANLITSEGWTNTTTKQEFALDDVVTVKVDGGSNSGKAYDGDHIRIYATDTPAGSLTITLASGYELVSIKITTVTGTYAYLCVGDGTEDISNISTTVSGSSVVLNSVKNGSNGKQVRITAIEVVYKAV